MNLKEKIALNGLKRRLDRGAISLAEAKAEYKKITGQDPDFDGQAALSAQSDSDSETSEKKTEQDPEANGYSGYTPPGVVTEPVTEKEPNQTEPEQSDDQPEKAIVIEDSPKRVDTKRTAKKVEDPK